MLGLRFRTGSPPLRRFLPEIVTFSGPEGSGKSTLARGLAESLARSGRRSLLRKGNRLGLGWYRAALLDRLGRPEPGRTARARSVSSAGPGEPAGVGGSGRLLGCALNALLLWPRVLADRVRGRTLLIFDRYAYDALAQVALAHPRRAAAIARLYPPPSAAFVVASPPERCAARRRSLPQSYFEARLLELRALADACPELVWIDNRDLDRAHEQVSRTVAQALAS